MRSHSRLHRSFPNASRGSLSRPAPCWMQTTWEASISPCILFLNSQNEARTKGKSDPEVPPGTGGQHTTRVESRQGARVPSGDGGGAPESLLAGLVSRAGYQAVRDWKQSRQYTGLSPRGWNGTSAVWPHWLQVVTNISRFPPPPPLPPREAPPP